MKKNRGNEILILRSCCGLPPKLEGKPKTYKTKKYISRKMLNLYYIKYTNET